MVELAVSRREAQDLGAAWKQEATELRREPLEEPGRLAPGPACVSHVRAPVA